MRKQVKITIDSLRDCQRDNLSIDEAIKYFERKSDFLSLKHHWYEGKPFCEFCGLPASRQSYKTQCPGYTLENLIKTEAQALGHTIDDVLTKCKKDEYVKLRRHVVKKATEAGWKLTQIASAMNLDHSTVWYILHRQKDF